MHVKSPTHAQTVVMHLAVLLTFLLLDAAWLTFVAASLFQTQLGDLMRPQPLIAAALLFYLIYATALAILAARPGLEAQSVAKAARNGALLGLASYGAFDLTNLAILKAWTPGLAAIDIAWGVVASAVSAAAGCLAALRFRGGRRT